jgi:hypothetical protein
MGHRARPQFDGGTERIERFSRLIFFVVDEAASPISPKYVVASSTTHSADWDFEMRSGQIGSTVTVAGQWAICETARILIRY